MKRLYRSQRDRKIAGIMGGLGEILGIDPTILRLAFVFVGIITGILPMLATYIIGWIIIPVGPLPPENDN